MLRRTMPTAERGIRLLALGALAGLALAAWRLVSPVPDGSEVPDGAVAVVNGVAVTRADFEQAVSAIATDRKGGLRPGDAARVLARLIDEELLLQRAQALGLVRREARVRGQLVGTMIETVLADAGAREPSDTELRSFYDANRQYFTPPGRLRVLHRAVPGTDGSARDRALALAAALERGETPAADPGVVTAPDTPLPPNKLEQYVGPSVVAVALGLPVGGVSQPIAAAGSYHVVRVVEREEPAPPPFEAVRAAVRAEAVRRRGEAALREYLDALRAEAEITTGAGVE
jgi:parvulin-like peptidyl-prolyl isomerase